MIAARVTALVLLAVAGCAAWRGEADSSSAVAVPVARAAVSVTVPARGELEALSASPIAVPRVPTGALKVKELVDEGVLVREGDIVVVFDDTELSVELDNHRATIRSTNRKIDRNDLQSHIEAGAVEVMKEVAELERDNFSAFKIVDEEIYSRREILEDEVRKETAEETIVFADASLLLRGEYYDIEERILNVEKGQVSGNLGRVQTSLGQLVLKAPIAGMIVYRKNWRGASVGVGDTLWPGNVILAIVDPASTALKAQVLERDAAGLAVGAAARVRVDARPDREFTGKVGSVAEISRPIERGSPVKYCEVRIDLADGDPSLLKPGMKGEARIVTATLEEAVVVPRAAVHGDGEQAYVLVEADEGTRRQPVVLGPGDLVRVVVTSGLAGGERVLLGDRSEEAAPAVDRAETPVAGS